MRLDVETIGWVLAAAAVGVGAWIQGAVGFGSMLVAVPLLVLIEPRLVPGPAIGATALLTALIAIRERRSIDLRGLRWAFAGAAPGVAAGSLTVAAIPHDRLAVPFAVLVLIAVGISATRRRLSKRAPTVTGVGAISGFMGTTAAIGGPPIALLYQDETGPRIRGTLNAYFTLVTPFQLGMLAAVGTFGVWEAKASLFLWPGVIVGFASSRPFARYIDRGRARGAVLSVAAVTAVAVLLRETLWS